MTDICLVLEGTYPYHTGGVSVWVDAIVSGMPDLTFSIVHLYYGRKPHERRYAVPDNVREIVDVSLNAPCGESPLSIELDTLASQVPAARLYHPLSTGFAGYLGTALKRIRHAPMLLTEHGLYWREAELGVGELECGFKIVETSSGALHLGRTWESWSATFRALALDAYASADLITTVCDYNRTQQIGLGADASKTCVIPNGIRMPRASERTMRRRTGTHQWHIALVGRVAPMKDIKTFIRACAYAQTALPEAAWSVIGPTGHDPAYFQECQDLVVKLGVHNFSFAGEADMPTVYPAIDCVVLTSASEAQPLALLEAMSYGIPVVATDVGGVADLVAPHGHDAAGGVCGVNDDEAIGNAIVRILEDDALYRACAQAGRARVEQTHTLEAMLEAYRGVYRRFIELP